jgi:peptidoglycan/xylan/chitin deacetylase (PgdA/CDA1 family)
MKQKFVVTMDIEQDISIYLKNSYVGVEEGIPPFLELLEKYGIVMDCFITADICKRFSKLIKNIAQKGHNIGCHGYDHSIQYYCERNYKKQLEDISRATKDIERVLGFKPNMFRAPNFSVDANTIKVLEQLDYEIDSSILPGRLVKKLKIFTIYNHTSAPNVPYNPSRETVTKKGDSPIIEIPLTENPNLKGAPLGMGYLNFKGLNETISATHHVKNEYITFLIHPWELVDLKKYHPDLKSWVYNICSSNLKPLDSFFEYVVKEYESTTFEDIYQAVDMT